MTMTRMLTNVLCAVVVPMIVVWMSENNLRAAETVVDPESPLKTVSTDFGLADGPSWDGVASLYIADVKGEKFFRYSPRDGAMREFLKNPGRISASFYNHGSLYLSDNGHGEILRVDNGAKSRIGGQDPAAQPPARPNDLVVDHQGGVYYTLTRQNQVIYISPEGVQSVAISQVETPNGITLSPDEKTLYVASFVPKKIFAYGVGTHGALSDVKLFSVMDDGPDRGADGMTIDRAGNVYCCGPTAVWIWNPKGDLIAKIETPTKPINCAFGGPKMRSLYITAFGGLYEQKMMISGRAPHPPSIEALQFSTDRRPSTTLPENVALHPDVVYAQYGARKLLMDICVPTDQPGPLPTIVVVHGGGWLNGDKTKFRALTLALASRGYVTAAIEYRLGEEANFPAAIHDCNAAVRFLRANADRHHVDPDRIGAVGGSAGGHLVGLMASGWKNERLQGAGGHDDESSQLQAAIVMAGPLEMTTGSVAERSRNDGEKSNSNKWIGKSIDDAPELYELADAYLKIDSDTCPILFMVGEHDHPERSEMSRNKLKSAGVWSDVIVYKDGKHGCWNLLPWFGEMVDDMDTFFSEQL